MERAAALVFPELPIGVGLNRFLWLWTDAIEGSAVYLVQLSPLLVPLLLAGAYKLFQWVGTIAAVLYVAVGLGAFLWAESHTSEQALLPLPTGRMRRHVVGNPIQKTPGSDGGKDAGIDVARLLAMVPDPRPHSPAAAESGRLPAPAAAPSLPATQPAAASGTFRHVGQMIDESHAAVYGSGKNVSSVEEAKDELDRLAEEIGVPGPASMRMEDLEAVAENIRSMVS